MPSSGVDCRGLPDRRAAVRIDVAAGWPRIMTKLARIGDGVEAPDYLAGLSVQRVETALNPVLAARHAAEDQGHRSRWTRFVSSSVCCCRVCPRPPSLSSSRWVMPGGHQLQRPTIPKIPAGHQLISSESVTQ